MHLILPTTYARIFTGKGQRVDADADTNTGHYLDSHVVLCIYIKGGTLKGRETHLGMSEDETEELITQLQESLAKFRSDKAHAAAKARCDAGTASDTDRILLARKDGSRMIGPSECATCPHHAGETYSMRWTWDTPTDERGASSKPRDFAAHLAQLEGAGSPVRMSQCPRCDEETSYDNA